MSWFSLIFTIILFFIPPIDGAVRLYENWTSQQLVLHLGFASLPLPPAIQSFLAFWSVIGLMVLVWVAVWLLAGAIINWFQWRHVDSWLEQLIEASKPPFVIRLFLIGCILTLFFTYIGLPLINLILETRLELNQQSIFLAIFGLIGELGRAMEVAARDERLWQEKHVTTKSKRPIVTFLLLQEFRDWIGSLRTKSKAG